MKSITGQFGSAIRLPPAVSAHHFYLFPAAKAPPLAFSSVSASVGVRVSSRVSNLQLKENWLDSLSCPFPENGTPGVVEPRTGLGTRCVLGVDPDSSGAVALLKADESGSSAQVFDSPHLKVSIGKRVRKRMDARSIVQLLQTFDAPLGTRHERMKIWMGTTAYIEQSNPFPQDGKQGWWSGGYNYGLWTGILVASGFTVVPVTARQWKDHFDLSRSCPSKDDSREAASALFPSMSSLLKRKKDHGRAEALLIAAYGMGLGKQL